jgi:2-polyprenyl-3-methyl-5-hydroxy-6-metoxy-1,4-benzoquinol methylase
MGRSAGLSVCGCAGMVYNPLKNTWKLDEDDIDVNYIMHLVKKK